LLAELDDPWPPGVLARPDRVPDPLLGFGAPGILELEEREVVLEVRSTGRRVLGFLQKRIQVDDGCRPLAYTLACRRYRPTSRPVKNYDFAYFRHADPWLEGHRPGAAGLPVALTPPPRPDKNALPWRGGERRSPRGVLACRYR
jgi:hypothetical protein